MIIHIESDELVLLLWFKSEENNVINRLGRDSNRLFNFVFEFESEPQRRFVKFDIGIGNLCRWDFGLYDR